MQTQFLILIYFKQPSNASIPSKLHACLLASLVLCIKIEKFKRQKKENMNAYALAQKKT